MNGIKANKMSRLKLNTQKDIEETYLRLRLKQDKPMFKLELLIAFRPGATLRQINNTRISNLCSDNNLE